MSLKVVLVAGLCVFLGLQFVGPARTNPASPPARAMTAQISVPADIDALLTRACRNCHSNDTRWPVYSYVAPAAWLVIRDVNQGRDHLNLSEWTYTPEEGADVLDKMCREAKRGKMPLRTYTLIHWSARLAPTDVTRLCAWSDEAATALMSAH